jgi:hypothetical protein
MCSTARCEICVATKHNDMFILSLIGPFLLVHREGRGGAQRHVLRVNDLKRQVFEAQLARSAAKTL